MFSVLKCLLGSADTKQLFKNPKRLWSDFRQVKFYWHEQKKASKPTAREALFGSRYADQGTDLEAQDSQRTRLLSGTERLERSSQRLRDSQRIANETEGIGAGILGDLHVQRQQILNTRDTLMEADGYVDKSLRTLKGMARRYVLAAASVNVQDANE